MATGLDFCQDLPNARFLTIKISTPKAQQPLSLHDRDALDEVVHSCRTPTSKEHKIPTVVTCPPAPRKPARRAASSCKRKLQFFETANQDEVEDFFRSSLLINSRAKRSCPCTYTKLPPVPIQLNGNGTEF